MNPILTLIESSAEWEQAFIASGVKIPHKWHDYQDHCHNCGTEDAQKPCIPYALKAFIRAEQYALLNKVREIVEERGKITKWFPVDDLLLALPEKQKEV